jgi:hypothetical protein
MSPNPYAPPAATTKAGEVRRVVNGVLIIGSTLFGALMVLTQALQLLGLFHPHSSLELFSTTRPRFRRLFEEES